MFTNIFLVEKFSKNYKWPERSQILGLIAIKKHHCVRLGHRLWLNCQFDINPDWALRVKHYFVVTEITENIIHTEHKLCFKTAIMRKVTRGKWDGSCVQGQGNSKYLDRSWKFHTWLQHSTVAIINESRFLVTSPTRLVRKCKKR